MLRSNAVTARGNVIVQFYVQEASTSRWRSADPSQFAYTSNALSAQQERAADSAWTGK